VKQKSGKTVHAWSFEYFGDNDINILSNEFELEWPPNSGVKQFIPEIDDGRFFSLKEARLKINSAQVKFLDVLQKKLKGT
jgi:predicted NUDIX family NTP pyrophosphohydrolase